MVLGTFPTEAGIPSNLEMFTYKMWEHGAVSMCQCVCCVCVCVCVHVGVCGQRGPSALVTLAGDRSRGRGRYYQALILWL